MPHFVQGNYRFEVGKIVCIEKDDEDGDPILFMKPPSSIIHQGEEIFHPGLGSQLEYGLCLAMAVGKRIDSDTRAMMSHLLGFGLLFDIYDRNELKALRKEGYPWTIAKGRDTFCPISEFTPLKDAGDPYGQEVYMELNGEEILNSTTRELEVGIEEAMQYISQFMTLSPGDIIGIRIKEGSGPVKEGDEMEAGISSIGILRNTVMTSRTPP